MQLPQIQLHSNKAILGIQQKNTQVEMKQPHAELQMKQPQADIQYEKKDGRLQIDQTEAFADADLKHINRRIKEWADKGRQHVLKAIATAVQQGNQMMRIENKGNVIPQIAKTNSEPAKLEFNIGFVPSSASKVKIQYSPGDLKIHIKQQTPDIKITANQPIINVKPGETNIYLKQKPSISFSVKGQNINITK